MARKRSDELVTETKTKVEEVTPQVPEYDCIIIGAGPAGLAAALYAARAKLRVLMLEGKMPGGQMSITDKIENYPGCVEPLTGMQLAENMEKQVEKFGVRSTFAYITSVQKIEDKIMLKTDEGKIFVGKTLIIATGWDPQKLKVPGEEELRGRGVSYCATCDGPFYKDKTVVVVGGGDSAVKEGIFLTRFAKKVYIIHRRDKLRAEKIVAEEAEKNDKIEFVWNSVVDSIAGEGGKVTSVKVKNVKGTKTDTLYADGVFIYVGSKPNSKFLGNLVKMDEQKFIVTNDEMETSVQGIYAAGDIRVKSLRQVVTAVADGAIAADSADHYING